MLPIGERRDTVIDEACGTSPHHDVAAFETKAAHSIGATFAAPQEDSRQTERDGDDRRPSILLVTVLMETEFGASDIAVDQAGVGIVV
jgi:hypothetical protein